MKLGGFGRIVDYDRIRAANFDYAELDLPEITELAEPDFEAFLGKVAEVDFPVLTGSRALPVAEPWFFTGMFSLDTYKDYMRNACIRAGRLGIRKIIIGNGKARWLLDENSLKLESNFISLLRMFADFAGEQGIEMILEPLGPDYSNYINTLPEALRVIRAAGAPNLYIMADLRHMYRAGESYENIVECAEFVHHIHVDYPNIFPERPYPCGDDGFDYSPFLSAIKHAGYDDTLTVEADIPADWVEARGGALEVLGEIL